METDNMEELRKEFEEKTGQKCLEEFQDGQERTHHFRPSYVKFLEQKLSKQVTDWDKLRARFFLECVDPIEPPIFGCLMGKLNMAPHDMFEWFKKNILIPKETK